MLGMDPYGPLSRQGNTDYLIDIALMQKAMQLNNEQKVEEIKVLAELTGLEVAKTIAKIF
jgi:hypothetical protein